MDLKVNHKTVIAFDLDDTLYKEVNFLRSAFSAIAQHILPGNWNSLYSTMYSQYGNKKDVFEFLEKEYGADKTELIHMYRSHYPKLGITQTPLELINTIKLFGGRTGVITDGRVHTQNNKLHALGIHDLLDFTIISEATGYDKTAPHNFKELEKLYPNLQLTYIADNPAKDFYYPNQLGWNTIGITDPGNHIHKQNIEHKNPQYLPHQWIKDLSELRIIK